MTDAYDVYIDVPDGAPELKRLLIAEGVSADHVSVIRKRSVWDVTAEESPWPLARCAEQTPTGTVVFAQDAPTSSTTAAEWFVWMQMVRSNSRPWSMIADHLTWEETEAFTTRPARRISVQPRPTAN